MDSQLVDIDEHVIIESRLISLNSKYATNYNNGDKNSNLDFDFNAVASKDAKTLYHTVAIQSAEIPASYYNVNLSNNVINCTEGSSTQSIVIAVGNYDANTFADAFATAYDILFPARPNMAFDLITGKFGLVSGTVNSDIVINLANTTAQILIGIDPKAGGTITFTGNATNTRSPFPRLANFLGITKIKVASNALAGGNYDSVSLNTSTLVDTISTTATAFGLTIYNNIGREGYVKAKRIDEIDIILTDQDDNIIDFNAVNWTMTIILNTHRKQTFSKMDGIINLQKLTRVVEAKTKPEPIEKEILKVKFIEDVKEQFDDFDDDVLLG